jgi:hypothetical protein
MKIGFEKVVALPAQPHANWVYFVLNLETDTATIYITGQDGTPYPAGSGSGGGGTVSGLLEVALVDTSRPATSLDASGYVFLDGSQRAVDYMINPATMNKKTFKIVCINADNMVRVLPAIGTINGNSYMEFGLNDSAAIYAYANKLQTVPA